MGGNGFKCKSVCVGECIQSKGVYFFINGREAKDKWEKNSNKQRRSQKAVTAAASSHQSSTATDPSIGFLLGFPSATQSSMSRSIDPPIPRTSSLNLHPHSNPARRGAGLLVDAPTTGRGGQQRPTTTKPTRSIIVITAATEAAPPAIRHHHAGSCVGKWCCCHCCGRGRGQGRADRRCRGLVVGYQ